MRPFAELLAWIAARLAAARARREAPADPRRIAARGLLRTAATSTRSLGRFSDSGGGCSPASRARGAAEED